ncbi:MAG: FAD-dependent oxidoreductase [Actinobacteria bacterium]|nr:FAD-dependent oxidoreductase [Actinomycetota bacterium]
MRIAIIGSGISGIAAATELHPEHEITMFEAADRIGGHAHTVDVELPDGRVAVDTGFIVFNEDNYPGFTGLLSSHGVTSQPTEMSFSVAQAHGVEYRGSNPSSVFAQRRNLVNPRHWRMIADLVRFNRATARLVADEAPWLGPDRLPGPGAVDTQSIAEFLNEGRYSADFVERFLIPFGSAIWSAEPQTFTQFPIQSYARFMSNHGLLGVSGRKQWRTVSGGSREYLTRVTAPFADRIHTRTPVLSIGETAGIPVVRTAHGEALFDEVILATHSDTALSLLERPTEQEAATLRQLRYYPNIATLHSDSSVMPRTRRAWASWNYHVGSAASGASVTYWMNLLQQLSTDTQLFVTLNRSDEIDPGAVLGEWVYHHPVFDTDALAAQRRRHEIQGTRHRWYAGAYWGYGFHEDGTQSGFEVARGLQSLQPVAEVVAA